MQLTEQVDVCIVGAMQTASVAAEIELLTDDRGGTPEAPHEVQDADKLGALKTSMEESGWQGAPVVVTGDCALTGSHRIAAANELQEEGIGIAIPRVDIADVCEQYGIDWNVHLAACDDDTYEAARTIVDQLPTAVVEYLGLDIH